MLFKGQERMAQNNNFMKILFSFLLGLFFFLKPNAGFTQIKPIKISGLVKNESGTGIEGISVIITESNQGAVTNLAGRFSIENIKLEEFTIEFSGTGYRTKTIRINQQVPKDEMKIVLEKFIPEMTAIRIWGKTDPLASVQRMADISGTFLTAGKKNEIINISNADANIALKTGRQFFAKVPGVFVYDMDGSGNQVNIATRGLDPHRSWEFNIRHNGVITNSDMYGYPASHFNPPMESIEKVELIRGTAALQYGAQFGGMINYVTKKPDSTKPVSYENMTTVGSFGLFSTYNALSGTSGKWSYSAYFSKRISKGYRKNSSSDFDGQFISIKYQATKKLLVKAEIGHSRYIYQLPGPLNDSMFLTDPRQSTRSRNWYSPDIFIPSLSAEWSLGSNTFMQFSISGVFGTRNSVQFIGFADAKDTISKITNQYKNRQVDIDQFNSITAETRIRHNYSLGLLKSVLSAGIQYMHNDLHRRQQGKGTTGSDYDLSLVTPGWGRDLHFKTKNLAFFAENNFYLTDALSISPGVRMETGETNMTGVISYYDSAKLPLSIKHLFPLFGISTQYRLNESVRFYAGIGQAYRPVIFKDVIPASSLDVINPDLKDAYGFNFEAGVNGKWKGLFSYDISYFHLGYNNRIGSMILEDVNGNSYNYRTNTGNSVTDGLEFFLEAVPLKGRDNFSISVFTSTAWMNARYTNATVVVGNKNINISGNKLESAPTWISRNGMRIFYKNISSSLQYSYVSESFSDPFNTKVPSANGSKGPVPSYGLWDFDVSAHFLKYFQVRLGVNNFLDKQYFTKRPTFYPDPGIWPSDGRSFYMTFGFKI
jgi:Fe(3+) dicitrate transport protein